MERLQAALEKARQNRTGGATETRERSSDRPVAVQRVVPNEAWKALKPISIERSRLKRNRLVALTEDKEMTAFDILRTKMIQQAQQNGWRRIAFVSPHKGCGKSTVTANIAFSLARQQDLRAIVIDFDLRRPTLAKILSQRCNHNMADVIEKRVRFEDHALRYGDTLAFGLNNGPVRNPSELLQSEKTRLALAEIEKVYEPDFLLFDMPPLMASDDNFAFLNSVDCALIVAAAERTRIDQIDVAERQIAALTNVMGVVLNKCRYTDGLYGYEYNY